MGQLDAATNVQNRFLPVVNHTVQRNYTFRNTNVLKNSAGYHDTIYRTDYPLLEATLSDFFFNDECGRLDLQNFIYEFKIKRHPFLYLDALNSVLREQQGLQFESYTTIELIQGTNYYLFQNYKYGDSIVKKPISHYKITRLVNDGILMQIDPVIRSGVFNIGLIFNNYQISGEFYTPVKIKDGVEVETVNKNLRTLNSLVLYEYPSNLYDYSSFGGPPLEA